MTLNEYLKEKPLYYNEIDYSRMPRAYNSIKKYIKLPKIIQIIGTNGKGSTGRFLSHMLFEKNLSVGHYTSPHIFKFNERIWLNGKNVNDDVLDSAHEKLQSILSKEFLKTLSYFEYTTFLAILIFSKNCDFVILEAGLGGEFDATSVFPKILSIITPIGYDHSSFLGNNIEEIATTKINSITSVALLSSQYEEIVYKVAKKVAKKNSCKLFSTEDILVSADEKKIKKLIREKNLPAFQEINLQSAFSALRILGFDIDLQQIDLSILPGRCQKIAKNITIDVGHNVMAAMMLAKNFKDKKVIFVYNCFKDKEYEEIISILTPIIEKIEIMPIRNERGMATNEIISICKHKDLEVSIFEGINRDKEYLVFGSFVVIEKFLKMKN